MLTGGAPLQQLEDAVTAKSRKDAGPSAGLRAVLDAAVAEVHEGEFLLDSFQHGMPFVHGNRAAKDENQDPTGQGSKGADALAMQPLATPAGVAAVNGQLLQSLQAARSQTEQLEQVGGCRVVLSASLWRSVGW